MDNKRKDVLCLNTKDKADVQQKLQIIRNRFKKRVCKKCGDEIHFVSQEGEKPLAYNVDGSTPHWKTCPSSLYTQKKASLTIMRKLAAFFLVKHNVDLEGEVNLTPREVQIVQASLESLLEKTSETNLDLNSNPEGEKVKGDMSFKPLPCDSIGDPDEERAPSEELVSEIEKGVKDGPIKPNTAEMKRAIEDIIQHSSE